MHLDKTLPTKFTALVEPHCLMRVCVHSLQYRTHLQYHPGQLAGTCFCGLKTRLHFSNMSKYSCMSSLRCNCICKLLAK